jgi:hypothetical protein
MYQLDIRVGHKQRGFQKLAKSTRLNKPKFRLGERGGDAFVKGLLGAQHSASPRNTS